jgi:hypothetical protein
MDINLKILGRFGATTLAIDADRGSLIGLFTSFFP